MDPPPGWSDSERVVIAGGPESGNSDLEPPYEQAELQATLMATGLGVASREAQELLAGNAGSDDKLALSQAVRMKKMIEDPSSLRFNDFKPHLGTAWCRPKSRLRNLGDPNDGTGHRAPSGRWQRQQMEIDYSTLPRCRAPVDLNQLRR